MENTLIWTTALNCIMQYRTRALILECLSESLSLTKSLRINRLSPFWELLILLQVTFWDMRLLLLLNYWLNCYNWNGAKPNCLKNNFWLHLTPLSILQYWVPPCGNHVVIYCPLLTSENKTPNKFEPLPRKLKFNFDQTEYR